MTGAPVMDRQSVSHAPVSGACWCWVSVGDRVHIAAGRAGGMAGPDSGRKRGRDGDMAGVVL